MTRALLIATALLAASGCQTIQAQPAQLQPTPSRAEQVVAAAKAASGGAAWDAPRGCIEEGTRGDGASAYTTRFSLRDYGMRVDNRRGGSTQSMGFDGTASWRTDAAGQTMVDSGEAAVREAVTTAYLSINGFFFPERFPATFTYVREDRVGERRYDVIDMLPARGRVFQVWFDRETHLIGRVVDGTGDRAVTVEASDYRTVGGLTVAYALRVTGPDGSVLDQGRLTSFRCGTVDSGVFVAPRG